MLRHKLKAIESLFKQMGYKLILGAELEFYTANNIEPIKEYLSKIDSLAGFEEESGENQYEIKFSVTSKPVELVTKIAKLKEYFDKNEVNYQALPFEGRPASSIHFHVNLVDEDGNNLFCDEEHLGYAVGGCLAHLEDSMRFFVRNDDSFKRFKLNSIETPKNVSWGGNNRTAAIRIPTSSMQDRRFEHRVTCSDADSAGALLHILVAAYLGLKKKISPPAKIYGIAYDKIYGLKPFIDNLNEAEMLYERSEIRKFVEAL